MKILALEAAALHIGFLGCYGNEWVATPNLDRLAAEGIVFDQHIADNPDTTRPIAERSVLTGRYAGDPVPLAVDHLTIDSLDDFASQAVKAIRPWLKGPSPLLWIEGPNLAPPWSLDDELLAAYADEDDDSLPLREPPVGLIDLDADDFQFLQDTYAAVVTFYDAQVGRIIDRLRKHGHLDKLLLCVTARHGLPLGEHGMIGTTRPWLHEELVHVPLLMRLPDGAHAGTRVLAQTQPVDLPATFSEFLGQPLSEGHGRSLWPLVRGEVEELRPYAWSNLRLGEREEWLLRTPELALLLPVAAPEDDPPRPPQLYVKPDDRWEINDLGPRMPEQVEALEKTLRQFAQAVREPGALVYPPLPDPDET